MVDLTLGRHVWRLFDADTDSPVGAPYAIVWRLLLLILVHRALLFDPALCHGAATPRAFSGASDFAE
ncbi:hypothetical protein AB6Q56_06200 [Dechloromonas sp. ARDL1]|uniref:hypothetical protein n=1 Tax=Dechloromonas sp. ARDL1 TaxID=3322121 RepID=UPI003DA705F8